jgi:DNA mismatch endonuclease, patch repair protein
MNRYASSCDGRSENSDCRHPASSTNAHMATWRPTTSFGAVVDLAVRELRRQPSSLMTRYSRLVDHSADALVPFQRGEGRTTVARSKLMGRIRQSRTGPEEAVARFLRLEGVAYRRNVRSLPGRPDFANQRAGFAVFVHGCFWHRHPGCNRATTPTRNAAFWQDKFDANVARDAAREDALAEIGLTVITVWECETVTAEALRQRLAPLLAETRLHVS